MTYAPRLRAVLASRSSSILLVTIALAVGSSLSAEERSKPYPVPPLSPEDSLETIQVPDGYRLELFAAEPLIEEPVAIAWDGDGRMFVAEMRTYMQDIDGRDQHRPVSRVSILEDTDQDGRADRHTVFVDRLVLPRMILPLRDSVVIRETNTFDLWEYKDTNGDGVADEKSMWHQGGPRGGNLEHQPSGLVWNIDNWIYTTYSAHRYRFTGGAVRREPLPFGSGQWGLGKDDVGRLFYSTAGGETPAMDFQRPAVYGRIRLPGEVPQRFKEVFPLVEIPDVQGGRGRVRSNDTLNHFTGCAGQSVFRGDRLPKDLRGDLIIPEPVGRLIRRAKVRNVQGKIVLENADPGSEFIRSTDPNFRPLNSATGPDGCLYIVDMYRGIIQEGNWVREGSYLRGVVKAYELQKNIGRGRIYRLVHEEFEPGPPPRLLSKSPSELIATLGHPNGWWRDTAQKLLVLSGENSVSSRLASMATSTDAPPLGRLHALWTLDGLDALPSETLAKATGDSDTRVRSAAIRIAEPLLATGDAGARDWLNALLRDDDPDVVVQALLSAQMSRQPDLDAITTDVLARHPENDALRGVHEAYQRNHAERLARERAAEELRRANEQTARLYERGRVTYATLCTTCHGDDGKGVPLEGAKSETKAPPLAGSPRVTGKADRLVRILLHGLTGPVDDKSYTEQMVAMGSNDDEWIASALTYIRRSFGHRADAITVDDVASVRASSGARNRPWTLAELHEFDPSLGNRRSWKLSASHGGSIRSAVDGSPDSRWATGKPQEPGMWFQIELPKTTRVSGIELDAGRSTRDFPAAWELRISDDGEEWSEPIANGRGTGPLTRLAFPAIETRFFRITQTGSKAGLFWSIHDLQVIGAPPPAPPTGGAPETELPPIAELAKRTGDATRGRTVFEKNCRTCHRVGDDGVRFGPNLSGVGLRLERTRLLESILDPTAVVDPAYRGLLVQTRRGKFVTGLVVAEDKEAITLLRQGGDEVVVRSKDVLLREEQKGTFMPAGLEKAMTEAELVDLVEYLAAQRDASTPARGEGTSQKANDPR